MSFLGIEEGYRSKADAWVSPKGKVYPLPASGNEGHFDFIMDNPRIFGVPPKVVQEIRDAEEEKDFKKAGKLGDDLLLKALRDGWIRVATSLGIVEYKNRLSRRQREALENWLMDNYPMNGKLNVGPNIFRGTLRDWLKSGDVSSAFSRALKYASRS